MQSGQLIPEAFQTFPEFIDDRMFKLVQFLIGSLKNEHAVVEDENTVRDEKNVGNIVADQQSGESELLLVMADHIQNGVLQEFAKTDSFAIWRMDAVTSRLVASRYLIEKHGGEMMVENLKEGGSIVTFTLPVYTENGEQLEEVN